MDITQFQVTLGTDLKPYSDTISLARCRIFYKGFNRNGGYITDEFADQLLSTIAYAPIKGIYSIDDYEDHGEKNSDGRIYGVVPKDYNLAWEDVVDEDGVMRTYATVDVLLYTALYEEANEITGKAQSMELFPPSIKGDWKILNGKKVFVYTAASFFGLQVLGEDVEPCFEGASFYSLQNSFKELIDKLEQYSMKKEEIKQMDLSKFKLSDDDKFEILFYKLNPNYTEEGNYQLDVWIMSVYDNYALVQTGYKTYERVYYTKNDETNEVMIGDREECFIVDVTDAEYKALQFIQNSNGNFENVDKVYTKGVESEEKISDFEQKIVDLENDKSTLTTERDELNGKVEEFTRLNSTLNETVETLNAQADEAKATIETLEAFKLSVETAKKNAVIEKYSKQLSDEVTKSYQEKLSDYTVESLEKELAFELVKTNPALFTAASGFVPKPQETKWKILDQYENKNK